MSSILTSKRRERAKRKSRSAHGRNAKTKNTSTYQTLTADSNNSIVSLPKTVSPNAETVASSPSSRSYRNRWASYDDDGAQSFVSSSSSSSPAMLVASTKRRENVTRQQQQSQPDHRGQQRSSSSNFDKINEKDERYILNDEMPMDELMGIKRQHTEQRQELQRKDKNSAAAYSSMAPTKEVSDVLGLSSIMTMASSFNWNTDQNSNHGDGDNNDNDNKYCIDSKQRNNSVPNSFVGGGSGIEQMIAALNSGSTACRPPNLNKKERILWDALQTAMINDRNEHLSKRRSLEIDLQKSTNRLDDMSVREIILEREVSEAKNDRADVEHKYTAMSIVVEQLQGRKNNKSKHSSNDEDANSNTSNRSDNVQQLKQIEIESLKVELASKELILKQQQDNHDSELRSIQRVLADIAAEKMNLAEALERAESNATESAATGTANMIQNEKDDHSNVNNEEEDKSTKERNISRNDASSCNEKEMNLPREEYNDIKKKYESLKVDAEKKAGRIVVLGNDLKAARAKVKDAIEEMKELKDQSESSNREIDNLEFELENSKSIFREKINRIEELEEEISHQHDELIQLKNDNEQQKQEFEMLKVDRERAIGEVVELKKENDRADTELQSVEKAREIAVTEIKKLKKAREHAVNEVEKAIIEAKAVKAEHSKSIDDASNTSDEGHDEFLLKKDELDIDDIEVDQTQETISSTYEEVQNLQKSLSETTSSLENAKKIIASLENANGSLALESRSRLKDKEEELSSIQKESEDRKRLLDSLATELRDLQRNQDDIQYADKRTRAQVLKQKALVGHLETSLSDLQSAVVVHEASLTMMDSNIAANSNIEEISEILGDTLYAIGATLETTELYVDEVGDENSIGVSEVDLSSEVGRHIDSIIRNDREAASQGLRLELDQKKVAVKRLEEALRKQNEEMKKLRIQFEARGRESCDNNHNWRTEIRSLRQQCSTNMEVLTKKERELSVLRSSLNVDENETGYISDDASDDEDDETEVESSISAAKLNAYGPAEAEAYAIILAQASGRIEIPRKNQEEVESLKRDLMEALGEKESASKELQVRRESLANAKMIISSLEKANKGMMEDLRSRLQDSNAAMQSLLNKSTEHKEAAEDLRTKVQKLEQEKLEERQKYEDEMEILRRQSPLFTKESTTRNENNNESLSEKKQEDFHPKTNLEECA